MRLQVTRAVSLTIYYPDWSNETMDAFIADCGHAIPATNAASGGTGYGFYKDGRKLCYNCCALQERATMIETGRATLYLVSRSPSPTEWHITDWPGKLDFPVLYRTKSTGRGFGGSYQVTTGRFVGPDGFVWSFRNAGDMDIARCTRTKQRSLKS